MRDLIVKEDSVALITGQLIDEAGLAITSSRMTAMRMWFFDHLGGIINAREDVDILNANGGSLDASGNFALRLSAADNPIVGGGADTIQPHTLLIRKVWDAANPQQDWDEIPIRVRNLTRVPVS